MSQPRKKSSSAGLLAVIIVSVFVCLILVFIPKKNSRHETDSKAPEPTTPPKTSGQLATAAAAVPTAPTSPLPPPVSTSAESLEKLAATDPSQALSLALAEKDEAQRDVLLQAVLRGWARTAPAAAANWAWDHQQTIEQGHAFSAIFDGVGEKPDEAIQLAQRLSSEHPEQTWSFGRYLIHSLTETGQFAQAADFAAASANPEHRIDLLTAAYHPWGKREPEKALQSAIALDDPLRQNAAFHATVDGWAQTNPQTLTEAAYKFPAGQDRSLALVTGLRNWIEKDPASAEAWIKTHQLTADESARALEE